MQKLTAKFDGILNMETNRANLKVQGMTCNHCASTVSGIIKQEGGKEVHVDYLMGEADFEPSSSINMERLISRLKAAGYEATAETTEPEAKGSMGSIEKKFLFTLPFSLLLFSHMFAPNHWWINNGWVQLTICIPVFVVGFMHFGKSTLEAIKSGNINMDVLILLGSTSAFGYSLYGVLTHGSNDHAHNFLFFETAATIITLVLLGYVIEHRAVQKTTAVLRELHKAKPEKAKKLVQNGLNQDLEVVNAHDLEVDNVILVNTGDRIPADGSIMHGDLSVNEAMLTGEAEQVSKTAGSKVYSGSLVMDGSATIKVTKSATDSTIGKIVELVKQSRSDKPSVQKLADKISSWFVPVIISIAILTLIINFYVAETSLTDAILRSIAVLVIACPCAMGLATPTAVSVGLGLAARLGIIVKKASVFEEINAIEEIVFDKTGTLTTGDLNILLNYIHPDFNQEIIWGIIKSMEQRSSHPIAQQFLKLTTSIEPIALSDIKEIKGKGMMAKYNDRHLRFGSALFCETNNHDSDLYLTHDSEVIASFSVIDEVKPDALETLRFLKSKGLTTHILSGDNERKTTKVAKELEIKNFHFGQLPDQKLAFIKSLKTHSKIGMVGDGINDSPSLAAANVGISMGNANALAADSAKVAILGSKMELLMRLFQISDKVVLTIKQNLFWAFSYNLIAIPLAALGYLNPMVAALSMAFSDVVVIGNSLRLRLILPKHLR